MATTFVVQSNIVAVASSAVFGDTDGLRITKSAGRPVAIHPVLFSKPRAQAPFTQIIESASFGVARPESMRHAASARIERSGLEPRPSVPRQTRIPDFLNSETGGSFPDKASVVRGQTTTIIFCRWSVSRDSAMWSSSR